MQNRQRKRGWKEIHLNGNFHSFLTCEPSTCYVLGTTPRTGDGATDGKDKVLALGTGQGRLVFFLDNFLHFPCCLKRACITSTIRPETKHQFYIYFHGHTSRVKTVCFTVKFLSFSPVYEAPVQTRRRRCFANEGR